MYFFPICFQELKTSVTSWSLMEKTPNNLHWKDAEEQQTRMEYVLYNVIKVKLAQTMSYALLLSVIYLFSFLSRGFADLWICGGL